MTTITRERVAEIIHAAGLEPCDYEEVFGTIKTGEIVAMARIALASLEAEPVSFDALRDAVAEVSGGPAMEWSDIYKGHQAVPFINFNSLARIVDKFRDSPAAHTVTFFRDGIEAAAAWVDQQRDSYDSEHGRHDPDTGAFEFGNDAQRDYSATLEEIAEGIRALHPNTAPPAPDVEMGRNPVLAYADSYRDMAKKGVETVPVWSVITDLERNIAPLYAATPAPEVNAEPGAWEWFHYKQWHVTNDPERARDVANGGVEVFPLFRAAMLQGKAENNEGEPTDDERLMAIEGILPPLNPGTPPAIPDGWVACSVRMPTKQDGTVFLTWNGQYVGKELFLMGSFQCLKPGIITHWMPLPAAPRQYEDK